MPEVRRLKKRKTANEKFAELIDRLYAADDLYKLAQAEREDTRKALLRAIRYGHRKHGLHYSQDAAIYVHTVRRKVFSQSKARELMGLKLYNRAFRTQQYVQIDALDLEQAAIQRTKESTNDDRNPPVDRPGGESEDRAADQVS